jgi:hypothetical protein
LAAATAEILGHPTTAADRLTGSSAGSQVFRVRTGTSGVVLKRYSEAEFGVARLVAQLPGGISAPLVGESSRLRVLCFEDLGGTTLADRLRLAEPDGPERRALAGAYVRAVVRVQQALATLGRPAPGPDPSSPAFSLDEFVGFSALSPGAGRHCTPGAQLALVAGLTRATTPPAAVQTAARSADRRLIRRFTSSARLRRSWIPADTNPSNLLPGRTAEYCWVDLAPTPGLPITNYLSLYGSSFKLNEAEALGALRGNGQDCVTGEDFRLLNGMFSVFTLADTCLGLAEGTRNGLVHSGLSYDQAEKFSLALAADLLHSGVAGADGYGPYLAWLQDTPRDPGATDAWAARSVS